LGQYRGITTITKNGVNFIAVRFKFQGKDFGVRNFTKLFGCKTQKSAYNVLENEVKPLLSQGKNPFLQTPKNLDEIFQEKINHKKDSSNGWSKYTISNYELFYKKAMKKKLGHKKLNKITYSDLESIIKNLENENKSPVWINRLVQILNPIFKDALKRNEVFENPCLKVEKTKYKKPDTIYDKIIDDNILVVAQRLYLAIDKYPVKTKGSEVEKKCYLYLILLNGRRIGETLNLKKENCYLKTRRIISPREITKQDEESVFPIPNECLEYFSSVKEGLLFPNIKRASVYLMFQRLLKISGVEVRNTKTITVHDVRSLLINNMIKNLTIDSRLADSCLDHQLKGTIREYASFEFNQKKDALEKYWNIVRNDEFAIKKAEFRKEFFKNFEIEFEKAWQKTNSK
jgi:integrase